MILFRTRRVNGLNFVDHFRSLYVSADFECAWAESD
jgi:hypothetical protein